MGVGIEKKSHLQPHVQLVHEDNFQPLYIYIPFRCCKIYIQEEINSIFYKNKGQAQQKDKICERNSVASAIKPPLKTIFNEKLEARPIAVTQSILCSSMIFHCIFRSNCVYNSPEKMLEKKLAPIRKERKYQPRFYYKRKKISVM